MEYTILILISKDKMRKDGVKSPNMADALLMAVSLIDDIRAYQDNPYTYKTAGSREENLFSIAGVR